LAERLEATGAGQVVLSIFVVLVLLAQISTHLPDSAIEDALSAPANQVIRVVAMEQAWGVFAPDPRSTSLKLEARVTFEDGTTTTWEVPDGPRIGANLRYYRWRKCLERIRSDSFSGLWRATAEWVAAEHSGGPSPVATVELVRFFRQNSISGPQPPYEQFTFFTLEVEPEDGP